MYLCAIEAAFVDEDGGFAELLNRSGNVLVGHLLGFWKDDFREALGECSITGR